MKKNILVIDDEKYQAEGLAKKLDKEYPDSNIFYAYEQDDIKDQIANKFYNLAIVDLRMDRFSFNGIELINLIAAQNPFAKILVVSAFTKEYMVSLSDLMAKGVILNFSEKELLEKWIPKLKLIIDDYYSKLEQNPSILSLSLVDYYSSIKNNSDTYEKGKEFEHFIALLFGNMGYMDISTRVIDKSNNEVDIIVRNEIDDNFLNKFGKYFLIECKNKPKDNVGKNDFIIFNNKLKQTSCMAELGILCTSGYIGKNTYLEAMRESNSDKKMIFISNPEIERLINSNNNIREEFKKILDGQVRDNKNL